MALQQLHPGAKWLFRSGVFATGLVVVLFLSLWIGSALGFMVKDLSWELFGSVVLLLVLLLACVAEIYAQLAYPRWRYELTPTYLRVERGVIWKRSSTVPYERVQNVDITRGVFARLLGFSTVLVQTAGYSGGGRGRMVAEGVLPAVSPQEAERIRTFLVKRISKRAQGL